jgi:hypothetical protein
MPRPRKSLEENHNPTTLTHDMNVKAVITLILGLVFQLAQVLPGAVVTSPCASNGVSCECCAGKDSCPCAKNGESDQKPAPLSSDSGSVLKLPAARADDNRAAIDSLMETHPSPSVVTSPVAGLCRRAPFGGVLLICHVRHRFSQANCVRPSPLLRRVC